MAEAAATTPKAKSKNDGLVKQADAPPEARNVTEEVPRSVDWDDLLGDDSDALPEFREVTEPPAASGAVDAEADAAPDEKSEAPTADAGEATPPEGTEKPRQEAAESVTESDGKDKKPEEVELQQKVWSEEELADAQKKYREKLAARYAMSEEQGDLLLRDPHQEVPKLLTELHQGIIQEVWSMMQNFVPQKLESDLKQRETRQKYERMFFDQWPKLRAHAQTVQRLANAYRQANPSATVEQAIQEIGAQAHIALKIPLEDEKPNEEKPSKPFTPERGASGTAPPPPPRELNPFEQFVEEVVEDEDF